MNTPALSGHLMAWILAVLPPLLAVAWVRPPSGSMVAVPVFLMVSLILFAGASFVGPPTSPVLTRRIKVLGVLPAAPLGLGMGLAIGGVSLLAGALSGYVAVGGLPLFFLVFLCAVFGLPFGLILGTYRASDKGLAAALPSMLGALLLSVPMAGLATMAWILIGAINS